MTDMKEYFLTGPGSGMTGIPLVREALRRTNRLGILGDYYEFGIFRGSTLYNAYDEATRLGNTSMHFWGFDSFQGLPEVKGIDSNRDIFHRGDYECTLENVIIHLTDCGVDWSRIDLISGWFEESLKSGPTDRMRKAAVILVDCDLYVSTVPVLDFILPLLQTGTVLIFDEYGNLGENSGEALAHLEFSERYPEIISRSKIGVNPSSGPRAFTIERNKS